MAMQEVKRRVQIAAILNSNESSYSSTSIAECYICGKGLQEGFTITAKTLPSGISLFCNLHFPSEKNFSKIQESKIKLF